MPSTPGETDNEEFPDEEPSDPVYEMDIANLQTLGRLRGPFAEMLAIYERRASFDMDALVRWGVRFRELASEIERILAESKWISSYDVIERDLRVDIDALTISYSNKPGETEDAFEFELRSGTPAEQERCQNWRDYIKPRHLYSAWVLDESGVFAWYVAGYAATGGDVWFAAGLSSETEQLLRYLNEHLLHCQHNHRIFLDESCVLHVSRESRDCPYKKLAEFAQSKWAAGTDKYKLAQSLVDGPAPYQSVLDSLLPRFSRSQQTRRYTAVITSLNRDLRAAEQNVHIAKDGANTVAVKLGYKQEKTPKRTS